MLLQSHFSFSVSNLDDVPDIYSAWAKDFFLTKALGKHVWQSISLLFCFSFWCRRTWGTGSTYPTAGQGLGHQSFPDTADRKHHPQQNAYRTRAGFQLQRICECLLERKSNKRSQAEICCWKKESCFNKAIDYYCFSDLLTHTVATLTPVLLSLTLLMCL